VIASHAALADDLLAMEPIISTGTTLDDFQSHTIFHVVRSALSHHDPQATCLQHHAHESGPVIVICLHQD
jgi:hypothetical protein